MIIVALFAVIVAGVVSWRRSRRPVEHGTEPPWPSSKPMVEEHEDDT